MSLRTLQDDISHWANGLGFSAVGYVTLGPSDHEQHLKHWLSQEYHGSMAYMAQNMNLRVEPSGLLPGALTAITVRMDYLTQARMAPAQAALINPRQGYIAQYALGRDYHKVIRQKLKKLAEKINAATTDLPNGPFISRACTDSAPILEKRLAEQSGLGWIGKNTLLNDKQRGSWCVIGELLTNLPFSEVKPESDNHCGSCQRCLDICPTKAFVGPYQLDARRCISYLTIESKAAIPLEFRAAIGNRIFGCDDCQLVCPWNKFAAHQIDQDFSARAQFKSRSLLELLSWTEAEFLTNTEGSPIRRTGFEGWRRNIAVALGNAPYDENIVNALESVRPDASDLVREHIDWALTRQMQKQTGIKS